MINLQKLDPNWQFAKDHGNALKPGKLNGNQDVKLCPCCYEPINKIPIEISEHSKELWILGCGIPIFYNFIKSCIILFIIQILTQTFLLTILNYFLQIQHSTNYNSWLLQLSTASPTLSSIETIIRCTSFAGLIIFVIYFRNQYKNLNSYYDERSCTPSDYSVFLSWKQQHTKFKTVLFNFFQNNFGNQLTLEDIIILPDIQLFFKTQKKLEQYIQIKKKILQDQLNTQQIDNLIYLTHKQIKQFCKQYSKNQKQDILKARNAIVTFKSDYQKTKVLKQFNNISLQKKKQYLGQQAIYLKIIEAPQPRQIIWENIKFQNLSTLKKAIIGWVLSLLVIGTTFIICYFLINLKSQIVNDNIHHIQFQTQHQTTTKYHIWIPVLLFIILLHLFNKYFLSWSLHQFTTKQKWVFSSQFEFSFAAKYIFGLFFNNGVIALIVQGLKNNNYIHQLGLIEQESIMFILCLTLLPILDIINPVYQLKRLKRKLYDQSKYFTQKQANQLMEDLPYVLGDRYAEVISLVWLTYLYASLVPSGTIFLLIYLCLYYWIDKYNLLRRSSLKKNIDSKAFMNFYNLFEFCVIIKPLGQIIFDYRLKNGPYLHSYIMLGIGFIYILGPVQYLSNKFFKEKFNLQSRNYQEVKDQFDETYRLYHPIERFLYINQHIRDRQMAGTKNITICCYNKTSIKSILSNKSMDVSKQQLIKNINKVKITFNKQIKNPQSINKQQISLKAEDTQQIKPQNNKYRIQENKQSNQQLVVRSNFKLSHYKKKVKMQQQGFN